MKALVNMIVLVIMVTPVKPFVSQSIPFTEELLGVCNLLYYQLMGKYQYHTEATIEYLENYL